MFEKMSMKKLLVLLLFLFGYVVAVMAHEPIRRVEGEIALGTTLPTHNLGNDGKLLGIKATIELRYNQRSLPLDYGLQFSVSDYRFRDHNESDSERNDAIYLMALSDYNFRRNEKASFFVGAGMGIADESSFCLMPRCGVELWRHLRITMAYHVSEKHLSGLSLTVGVVFGGGKKK